RTVSAMGGPIVAVAVAPDGESLVSGGQKFNVWHWDLQSGRGEERLQGVGEQTDALAFSRDGKLLAAADEDGVKLWDAGEGRQPRKLAERGHRPERLALSPDGRRLASTGRGPEVLVWDLTRGVPVGRLTNPGGPAGAVAFSPDGRALATCGPEAVVRLWEVTSGKERRRFGGHGAAATAVAFSPDGRWLVSGSCDTTALVWEVTSPGGKTGPPSAREQDSLWSELAAADAAGAYLAMCRLAADPASALPLLKERLKMEGPDGELPRLLGAGVRDVDSDQFEARASASRNLAAKGELARAAIAKALGGQPSTEARRRLEELRGQLDGEPPGLAVLREGRAIEVIEWVGTEAAQQLLEVAARGDAAAPRTRDARAALDRLRRKPR